jgi:hypothetical protein
MWSDKDSAHVPDYHFHRKTSKWIAGRLAHNRPGHIALQVDTFYSTDMGPSLLSFTLNMVVKNE